MASRLSSTKSGRLGGSSRSGRLSGPSVDLNSAEGLYSVSQAVGGRVGQKANQIYADQESLLSRISSKVGSGFRTTLDYAMRFNYAGASAFKNVYDNDPLTTFSGGLKSGITGVTKHTYTDVFEEAGWTPETKTGKFAKGTAGFALDVLLDPTTYVTFGTFAGAKVATRAGISTVSKSGMKAGKNLAAEQGKDFSLDFMQKTLYNMEKEAPELFKTFIDNGGVKFFGNTMISGGRIAGAIKAVPGMTKLDTVTQPVRNSVYALFHRDASATYGKLPDEFIMLKQRLIDLGKVRSASAINKLTDITMANKITATEAEFISSAMEAGKHIADFRLNNAKKLYEEALGLALSEEKRVGILTGELPNYVPHMLLREVAHLANFNAKGVRSALGSEKGRKVVKFVSELGEEKIGTSKFLGLKKVDRIKGLNHALTVGQFKSIKQVEKALTKYGFKLRFVDKPAVSRGSAYGYFHPATNEIVVASGRPLKEVISTLQHEITHGTHARIASVIDLSETYTGQGAKKLKEALADTKSAVREEWKSIHKAMNLDYSRVVGEDKVYYKKPTELMAFALQQINKDRANATKLFPKTVKTLDRLLTFGPGKNAMKEIPSTGMLLDSQIYKDKAGVLYKKQEATIDEIHVAFGSKFFDENIVTSAAIRVTAGANAVTNKEFLQEAGAVFGRIAEEAPSNYVAAGAKELDGLLFHPAIAEQIDNFGAALVNDDSINNLMKAFDKAQGLWKASVTSLFPAFHGRNAISNVFLNYLDIGSAAISPGKHVLSTQLQLMDGKVKKLERLIMAGGDEAESATAVLKGILDTPVLTDAFGKKWNFGSLRKEIIEKRVAFGDEFTGFLDLREEVLDKIGALQKSTGKKVAEAANPLSQHNIAFKTGRKVGNAIEQQARVLNFITNLERTGDVVTSAARTKQFIFDYTNLSDFEKIFMRRLIPFYTFTRKNLALQVRQAVKQPGKLAVQAKLFVNISKGMSGSTLTEEETKNLPEFLQDGLGILYKREGNNVTIIDSLGTPLEAMFGALKPNAILGSMSPIVAVPLQTAIGKHFFFDTDLKDVNNAIAYEGAPDFVKDYIGYTTKESQSGKTIHIALNPTRMFIMNNIPPSSRIISTIGQLNEENVSGKLKVLRMLSGIKPYGQDLEYQASLREKEKMRELQDLLEETGVAPVFRRSFIPND